jgi:hypothetical protein
MSLQLKSFEKPPKRWKGRLISVTAIMLLIGGLYTLVIAISPFISSQTINPKNNSTTQLISKTENKITENRLYIPKIDINLPYASGGVETMEHGAWWRKPENGNPKDGGNFVLSAHRFIMGLTPQQTLRKSPFYNIDKLAVGDEIIIDYEGVRYAYTIREKLSVKPEATEIEQRTTQSQLTLYSCTLGGANDGRDVFIAKLKK